MQYITSSSNNLIKEIAKYKDGKDDAILVEGVKIIKEVAKYGLYCSKLFALEDKFDLVKDYITESCEVYFVSQNVLEKLSSTNTPQGVVGLVFVEDKKISAPKGNFLVLDNLQDPGNFGTICRSALGADFKDIYVIDCPSYKSSKMIRSTMGTIFGLNIYPTNYEELKQLLNKNNLPLLVADLDGENIFDYNPPKQFGIVIGNEGNGVSDEIVSMSTQKITIPMHNDLESLNAGVSAGICMYVLSNKRS